MLRIYVTITTFACLSFFGVTVAAAQGDIDFAALAKPLYESIASGNYAAAAAFALVLLVALVRRYGGERYPILSHKLIAPLLVFTASFAAAVASTAVADASVTLGTLFAALKVAVYASGGYTVAKLYLDAVKGKAPSWLQAPLAILSAILSAKGNAKAAAITKAEKAGEKAVEEQPSLGIDLDFKDVE